MSAPEQTGDSGDRGGIAVPPEVPEEFAAAYRAAYARALAAQSPHPHRRLRHDPGRERGEVRDDPDALPERDEDPVVGTHREGDDTSWHRLRAEPWFIPGLLLVIGLLLVLMSYLIGIAFAAQLNSTR